MGAITIAHSLSRMNKEKKKKTKGISRTTDEWTVHWKREKERESKWMRCACVTVLELPTKPSKYLGLLPRMFRTVFFLRGLVLLWSRTLAYLCWLVLFTTTILLPAFHGPFAMVWSLTGPFTFSFLFAKKNSQEQNPALSTTYSTATDSCSLRSWVCVHGIVDEKFFFTLDVFCLESYSPLAEPTPIQIWPYFPWIFIRLLLVLYERDWVFSCKSTLANVVCAFFLSQMTKGKFHIKSSHHWWYFSLYEI